MDIHDPGDEDRQAIDYEPLGYRIHGIAHGPSRRGRVTITLCGTTGGRTTHVQALITCPHCIHAMLPVTAIGPVDLGAVSDRRLQMR